MGDKINGLAPAASPDSETTACHLSVRTAAVSQAGSPAPLLSSTHGAQGAAGRQRAVAALKAVCLAAVCLVVLVGVLLRARSTASRKAPQGGTVRLAVLADTHITGPEYPLNSENGPLDNSAITRTQQRLYRAVRTINAITPSPQLVLFGGDVVHNGLERLQELGLNRSGLDRLYQEPVNGYKVAAALLSELKPPALYAWGNHDNVVVCGDSAASPSRELTASVYQHFFGGGAKPYAVRDVGHSWRVVSLNSMYGYTWDAQDPRCNPKLSSYGEQQLHWLDGQLAGGKHTIVMMHFPASTSVLDEVDTTAGWRDLRSVLSAHRDTVKLVLAGHFHKGLDWEGLYPFPARIMPAVRYNPQNFFVLDLHPDGTWELLDAAKNRGGARCSDWWSYDGEARREGDVQLRDAGDCGIPLAGGESEFDLPPVQGPASYPPLDQFNPERSCRFQLMPPFLEACAAGASPSCCAVLERATQLSSSAPFSTCFCHPSFWQRAVQHMSERYSADLAGLLSRCVSEHGKLLTWRGGPLTWCPSAQEV